MGRSHRVVGWSVVRSGLWFLLTLFLTSAWAQNPFNPYNPYNNPANFSDESFLTNRWVQHLIALGLGALIGAFFSHKLRRIRRWVILGGIAVWAVLMAVAFAIFGNVVAFLIGFVGALFVLREAIESRLARQKQAPKPTTFGSAE